MSATRAPFQIRVSHFSMPKDKCALPFVVGSATQHRLDAVDESYNSQDCANIIIGRSEIVAVVSDGCGGTHQQLRATSRSSNEVGAKLLSHFVSRDAYALLSRGAMGNPLGFVEKLSSLTQTRLRSIVESLAGLRSAEKEVFVWDYLMATVLGFAVTNREYVIFSAGDGVVGLNGVVQLLDAQEGVYLASSLIGPARRRRSRKFLSRFALRPFAFGPIEDLKSIFIGTDGIYEVARKYPDHLRAFVNQSPDPRQLKNGFDFLLQEFRRSIAWNPQLQLHWDDDVTFALLRRTAKE